jgi:hypothetical protein
MRYNAQVIAHGLACMHGAITNWAVALISAKLHGVFSLAAT